MGILTATIPNKLSIAINYRRLNTLSLQTTIKNAFKIASMKYQIGYFICDLCIFTTVKNWSISNIEHVLFTTNLISPCYIILCYVEDMPLVTSRDSNHNTDNNFLTRDKYVIQTNMDKNKIGNNILYSIERFTIAKQKIDNNNNNFTSINNIIENFKIYPIINEQTIYYSILSPKINFHFTYIN